MFKKFLGGLTNRNVLYYPGCLSKFAQVDIANNYLKILRFLGMNVITLKDFELCCGLPALNAGYKEDFNNLKEKNLKLFKEHGVGKIITNCPACYYVFSKEYKMDTEHITQLLVKYVNQFRKWYDNEKVTYHDPCYLGRGSGIYDEPRKILKEIGFEVIEFDRNRNHSFCCGGGGGLKTNSPTIANEIAKERLRQCKTKKIITTCPMCYAHLKENAQGIEVLELSEVLI